MQIVQTVVGDKRLAMEQGEFVRQFAFGSNWGFIRVGLRLALGGVATVNNGQFQVGLCSGVTDTFNSNTTTDYLGLQFGGTILGNAQFTFNAGAPAYFQTSNAYITVRRQNTTNTTGSIGSNNYFVGAVSGNRSVLLFDFKRIDSATVNVNPWNPGSSGNAQLDFSNYMLWRCCENEQAPLLVTQGASNANVACGSSYDALSIYWNMMTPTWEISDILVTRFY